MNKMTEATTKTNEGASGLVPKLRFPEFHKAGAWKKQPLSQLAKRCTQKNGQGELTRVLTNSAEFGVVDQRDYFDKDIANQSNLEGYYIVEKGDYVYNPRISVTAPVGPISKNNIVAGVMSPLYTVFRFNESHNDFYAYFFKTTGWHSYMRQASSTGARHDRMAVTNDDFLAMPLPVTCRDEQQKITDCLSSLDELIIAEAQKVEALKAHKTGLMQLLFPAEGETVPKLRFPEFHDAPEWEEVALEKIFAEKVEKGHPEKTVLSATQDRGVIPYEILEKSVIRDRKNLAGYKLVQSGNFVISLRSFEGGFEYSDYEGIISPAYVILEKKLDISNAFFQVMLKSSTFIMKIHKLLNNSLRDGKSISYNQAKEIMLIIPAPAEQRKIANCVLYVDELITAQAQKVEALKAHKNGLMQQLFPSMIDGAE